MEIIKLPDRTEYRLNGDLHREDGPAVEYINGDVLYYMNGKRHRLGNPAIERTSGYKAYFMNGELHREDGPAVEYSNGYKYYCVNGELHREGGPAVIRGKHAEVWINGVKMSETDEYHIPGKSARKK